MTKRMGFLALSDTMCQYLKNSDIFKLTYEPNLLFELLNGTMKSYFIGGYSSIRTLNFRQCEKGEKRWESI